MPTPTRPVPPPARPGTQPPRRRAAWDLYLLIPLAFLTSVFFWQIHYAIMRLNYFHHILPWRIAEGLGIVCTLLPHALCIIIAVTYIGRRPNLALCAILVVLTALPVLAVVVVGCDPNWGARSCRGQLGDARGIAIRYRGHADTPKSPLWAPGDLRRQNFVDLGEDLPPRAAVSAAAPHLIVAYSDRAFPDTGVVLYQHCCDRYVYFGHCRPVAFADGHAELVLVSDLPRVFAAHNAARAALGLPPQTLNATPHE